MTPPISLFEQQKLRIILGRQLLEFRLLGGFTTCRDLANATHISAATIGNIESGRATSKDVTVNMILKLTDKLPCKFIITTTEEWDGKTSLKKLFEAGARLGLVAK
jgi:transcriptional regulator with XRE-family HTH domain